MNKEPVDPPLKFLLIVGLRPRGHGAVVELKLPLNPLIEEKVKGEEEDGTAGVKIIA